MEVDKTRQTVKLFDKSNALIGVLSGHRRKRREAVAVRHAEGDRGQPQSDLSLQSGLPLQGRAFRQAVHDQARPQQPRRHGVDQLVGGRIRDPRHARAWKGLEGGIARLRASYELGCRARGRECSKGTPVEFARPSLRSGGLIERDSRPPAGERLAAATTDLGRSRPSVDDDMVHGDCRLSTDHDRQSERLASPPGCS